jgi:GcrA cell cycle regulator
MEKSWSFWSDERIEMLKELWSAGLSASQIAERIGGISRNAVMGKVYRLNLETREKVTLTGGIRKVAKSQSARSRKAPFDPKAVAELQKVMDRAPPPIVKSVVMPKSLEMKLLDLGNNDCRWPSGEKADTTFCGHNVERDKVYCTYHCRLAYRPREINVRSIAALVRRAA